MVVDAVRDEDGELIGFAKITRDITERRAAQEALRDSERQFRLLVAGVTDYALYMLDPDGIVTSWNAGAERIKGYAADEIVGRHFSRFYTEKDRGSRPACAALCRPPREQGRFEAEGWRVRKDGTLFWANVVIDAIRDETGKLIGFAKITRDITERREAQDALRSAPERCPGAEDGGARPATGGVAHDFNNLLMIVSGHLETIKRPASDEPKASARRKRSQAAAGRGELLTRQLLTFARGRR